MLSPYQELWNEFEWEKELRKDDARVHTYLEELPDFIDLPQEDAVILKRIQRHEELIPHGGVWPTPGQQPFQDGGEDEEEAAGHAPDDIWLHRDGAEIYLMTEKIARELAVQFALDPVLFESREIMRILCLAGKIMARSADVINLEPGEFRTLKIALCKRLMQDLNQMLGMLQHMADLAASEETASHIDLLAAQLRVVHERTSDLLSDNRKADPPKPKF